MNARMPVMRHRQSFARLFPAFLLAVLYPLAAGQNYCDPELCPSGRHVACQNSGRFVSGCSGEFVPIDPQIPLILQLHNERRNQIAGGGLSGFPSAVHMATMSWDPTLAQLAAYNALQCRMAHDECRNTNTYRYAGQNLSILFTRSGDVADFLRQRIAAWFDENRYATSGDMENYQMRGGPAIGHFTTMVNERNSRVGCAIARFTDANNVQATLLACDYAVTNVLNNPVYRAGAPASECTSGRNPTYPNLCAVNENYNFNQWSG
ncbi:antigen 5 like allergen Cul n 1 isoform X2 [Drosophila subobscura]|uniref:antigen 5 like allergen Cul n 1 isoform X1 n=1 Tax=Drosophila subobscura TaxID=7241 RepID=UPI00155AEB87|nr:antigen 5 like allergen Cul n 1 isoform X1 [Drosophila subobscura]XP_034654405.1 antigen 5 like allergen Cul n 1 isoform X2 [Drosophila subobscura]